MSCWGYGGRHGRAGENPAGTPGAVDAYRRGHLSRATLLGRRRSGRSGREAARTAGRVASYRYRVAGSRGLRRRTARGRVVVGRGMAPFDTAVPTLTTGRLTSDGHGAARVARGVWLLRSRPVDLEQVRQPRDLQQPEDLRL